MKRLIALAWAASLAAVPGVAWADSGLNVRITAHIDDFCRIYPPDDDQLIVRNGSANIGQVKEICNTPNGYSVSASFSNVRSGILDVGTQSYSLVNGIATRVTTMPAVRTSPWRLRRAELSAASAPVVMVVTIAPR